MGGFQVTECRGLVIAAPASSSGKTTVALGILRWAAMAGLPVRAAKCGPDYIDPTFHAIASGRPSVNLDAWAMSDTELRRLAACPGIGPGPAGFLLVEGAMGVLDGGGSTQAGSAADLSRKLGLPIVLVIDVSGQGASAVLPVLGLRSAFRGVEVKGVILNRLGSERHGRVVRTAMDSHGIRVFGGLHRNEDLALPSRHLGLVPAGEHSEVASFLDQAARAVGSGVDVEALLSSAEPLRPSASTGSGPALPPPGQRISIARDDAFAFVYEHLLTGWHRAGAELSFFSPLDDQPPDDTADSIFLPGGYPELHAGRLAGAGRFRRGMHATISRGATVHGECGGYMVLGRGLVDRDGGHHRMLGLLPHSTSFARPRLHLGYRLLRALEGAPFEGVLAGHEFHYSSLEGEEAGRALFEAEDADGNRIGRIGGIDGGVSGSYVHVICAADPKRPDLPPGW